MRKKYLTPQISIIMLEPQAILAGSGPTSGSITPESEIKSGDGDDVWE